MMDTTPAEAKVAVMGRNHRCNNSERLLADNYQEVEEEVQEADREKLEEQCDWANKKEKISPHS